MWIMFVFVGFLSIIIAGSGYTNYIRREVPTDNREIAAYVAKYYTFNQVAAIYWRANPSANGNFCWDTLKMAVGVPTTLRNANISSYNGRTWRMIARGVDGYVLCTEMPDAARGLAQVNLEAQCNTQTTCS